MLKFTFKNTWHCRNFKWLFPGRWNIAKSFNYENFYPIVVLYKVNNVDLQGVIINFT